MLDKYNFDNFTVRLAFDLDEIEAAQRLRYDVFIDENTDNVGETEFARLDLVSEIYTLVIHCF